MKGSVNSLTGRAEPLEGSYLRTFALELKERLSQTLAAFVTSSLPRACGRLDAEDAAEPSPARSLKCCSR